MPMLGLVNLGAMSKLSQEKTMLSRRDFLKIGSIGAAVGLVGVVGYVTIGKKFNPFALKFIPADLLGPLDINKFQSALLIPPVMPKAGTIGSGGDEIDYYEISMRQFEQQILPEGMPKTTVWGYGAVKSASKDGLLLHNAPSLTIEATSQRPVRIEWINDLVDEKGNYRRIFYQWIQLCTGLTQAVGKPCVICDRLLNLLLKVIQARCRSLRMCTGRLA